MALKDKKIRTDYSNAAFWLTGELRNLGKDDPLHLFASKIDKLEGYLKDIDNLASLYETDVVILEKISSLFFFFREIKKTNNLYDLSVCVAKAYAAASYLNADFQRNITHIDLNRLRSQEEVDSGRSELRFS